MSDMTGQTGPLLHRLMRACHVPTALPFFMTLQTQGCRLFHQHIDKITGMDGMTRRTVPCCERFMHSRHLFLRIVAVNTKCPCIFRYNRLAACTDSMTGLTITCSNNLMDDGL